MTFHQIALERQSVFGGDDLRNAQIVRDLDEFAHHLQFVFRVGKVQRAALPMPRPGSPQEVYPMTTATQGEVPELAERLPDHPHHPKVSNRSAHWPWVALQNEHLPSPTREVVGVGEPHDP